jgi:hypothetical protein
MRPRGKVAVLTGAAAAIKGSLAQVHDQRHRPYLRYLRSFALNSCFAATGKKVITQITQRPANNANSHALPPPLATPSTTGTVHT